MVPHPRFCALIAAGLVFAACSSKAVEQTDEYQAVIDERDELADDLDAARAELEELSDDLDDLDERLAVAESQLADADAAVAANDAIVSDLTDVLAVDLINRAGFSRSDADCVVDGFLADDQVRASYLMLIGPDPITDQGVAEAAIDDVNAVLSGCGIEVPGADDDPAPPAGPPIEAMLGDVEVIGAPLPEFTETDDPAVGATAPVLVGAGYDGGPITVDAAADGPTMLIFLAHWCPHCNAEIPKLNELRDDGRIPDGVDVVAVSSLVSPSRPNYPPDTWLVESDWTFPTIADGADGAGQYVAAEAFGLLGVPYVILIDGDGIVTERWAGERSVDELADALARLAP